MLHQSPKTIPTALRAIMLCCISITAHANMDSDFLIRSGNLLQNQTYMNNYIENYGTSPMTSAKLDTAMVLSNSYNAKQLLDFKLEYFDRINTYTAGFGLTHRAKNGPDYYQGFSGGVDYTKYDEMEFMQAIIGTETKYAGYSADLNIYMPFGSAQAYDGGFSSTLVGMPGLDLRIGTSYDALELNFDASYFSASTVKNKLSSLGASLRYQFNNSLLVGAKYQITRGLDSENSGYGAFIALPLSRDVHAQHHTSALSSAPTQRMLGALINGQSITCATGESYAYHGNTICATSNPFSSAFIRSKKLKQGLSLTDADQSVLSAGDLVFNAQTMTIIDNVIKAKTLTIKEGAVLVFTKNGFIIAEADGSVLGESGDKLKATLIRSGLLGRQLDTSTSSMQLNGVKRILGRYGIDTTDDEAAKSVNNPGHFIALTGSSFMDFNALIDSSNYESAASMPILSGVSATASGAAGDRASALTATTGPLKDVIMGGNDATNGALTKYAQINNVNFSNGGVMLLGANASFNSVNFDGGNHSHIYQVGGLVESTTTAHTAGAQLESFVIGRGGAQYTAIGNLYDQRNAENTNFKGIVSKDAHATVGANQASNNNDKLPTIAIMQSFFNMGTANAAAKKNAISISEQNAATGTSGLGLVLLSNVVNMPSVTSSLTNGQTASLFGDIESNNAVNKFGLVPDTVVAGDILVVGLNLVGATGSDNTLLSYGAGFGKITQPGASGAYAQGGTTFAFGLDGCANNLCSAYIPNDFVNDTVNAIAAPGTLPDSANANVTALQAFIKPQANAISLTNSTTTEFYQHASLVPTTISGRQQVNIDAYTSRLGSNAQLSSADDGTSSTSEIYRIAASKAAFLNANTLTRGEMIQQIIVESRPNTSLKTETLNKLRTKAAAS